MMRLGDIAVRIEGTLPLPAAPERNGGLGGGVAAILVEIAARLERLATEGETALIDIRSLPLSPADRIELLEALGRGEVTATLDAQGVSTLRETAFAGVWWIEHRDRDAEVTAELLEVTLAPHILAADPKDIAIAAAALRRRLGATHPMVADLKAAGSTTAAAAHSA
jgi:hydrogenase-1 operon protein HyaF